ncbi:MAG: ABC transporter ATP-binding protein [Gammaproteobacteria bacterium]|nr:ABC transporter ATP-binding protein [Gammaproteobacteria bacterium]
MTIFNITFKDLNKSFNQRLLFNIPELTIESGKCCLLSGINGSGKSTLLKILAGLENPNNAEVYYKNIKMSWKSACKQIHKNIIYLHQTPLMFDASVEDNIKYGMRKQGFSRDKIKTNTKNALQWADLEHLKNNNARMLSGGEKQRVALARAYVLSPKILLLDESFSNIDAQGRKQIAEQICKLKDEGIGIILTSHELSHTTSLAEHHMQLENNRLITSSNENNVTNFKNNFEPSSLLLVNA